METAKSSLEHVRHSLTYGEVMREVLTALKFLQRGVGGDVVAHVDGCCHDGVTPVEVCVRWLLVGEEDATGVVYHCAHAIGIECTGDVSGGSPLCSVSGDQQDRVRHL